ncbi:aldose 1-epimerase [Vallitalea longa]|uniref:Aldose 1-epimerase n=1 Tax=Vallitalea longa TaxID=2936439 RepID=A0A9W5YCM9_9FIRM|nr:aldose epimerase family protein [Vallitalea longa]GKX31537.1 aldose 1-epimerase [Vallitalea longa]
MNIQKKYFGVLKNNQDVFKYTLSNDKGLEISILNYGGIITDIIVPDRNGYKENITLSFNNIKDYEEKSPHFGCITGRVAGRISNGEFSIDNKKYKLCKNDNNACIHGGETGLSKRVWNVRKMINDKDIGIELSYFSPHMEDGFPGNVDFKVLYTLNNNNEFTIEYYGNTDEKTILNLTNHAYFNLEGAGEGLILDHILKVNSKYYVPVDNELIPLGHLEKIDNTPLDFNEGKKIKQAVESKYIQVQTVGGIDHAFVLKGLSDKPNIVVSNEKTGRYMKVKTDQQVAVIYTSCQLDNNLILANGLKTKRYGGLCLETQDFPDAVNQKNFRTNYYNKQKPYYAKTIFEFGSIV